MGVHYNDSISHTVFVDSFDFMINKFFSRRFVAVAAPQPMQIVYIIYVNYELLIIQIGPRAFAL